MDKKKWNVMIYLVGDNNLSEDIAGSLAEIEAVASLLPPNIRTFAFFDGGNPMIWPQLYGSDTKEQVPVDKDMKKIDLSRPVDTAVNSADKETMVNFVKHCKKQFPADEYIFIISAHGDGFLGRTLLRDENPGSNMTVAELKDALGEIKGVLGQRISILGFDSCLMNMLEIGYEIRKKAKIFLTSSGNVPNAGWNYSSILSSLAEGLGNHSPADYARSFVEKFVDHQAKFAVGGRSVELTATYFEDDKGVSHMTEIGKAVNDLAATLIDNAMLKVPENTLSQQEKLFRDTVLSFILESHYECQTSMYDQAVDISDFCKLLGEKCCSLRELNGLFRIVRTEARAGAERYNGDIPPGLGIVLAEDVALRSSKIATACDTVVNKVSAATILAGFVGAERQFVHGMSIFFPWTYVGLSLTEPKYLDLKLTDKYGNWLEFLRLYLDLTFRRPEKKGISDFNKSNPRYGEKGMDSDTYLNYFSRIKNFNWDYSSRRPVKEAAAAAGNDGSTES